MFLQSLVSHAGKSGREVHCALGGEVTRGSDYAAAHALALTTMAALQVLGFPHRVYKADDLGSLGVILAAQRDNPHAYSPIKEIRPLITYDAQHGTELTRTAWAYSEYRENVKATATRLKVHENTIRQRLTRVADLIGTDWQEARFLDVQLGLRIWSLSQPANQA